MGQHASHPMHRKVGLVSSNASALAHPLWWMALVVLVVNDRLHALERSTGKQVWSIPVETQGRGDRGAHGGNRQPLREGAPPREAAWFLAWPAQPKRVRLRRKRPFFELSDHGSAG